MKVYICRYVSLADPGDLLLGYIWRKAVLVLGPEDSCGPDDALLVPHVYFEERMFDYETGQNVGETYNYCLDRKCWHPDCGPTKLIFEG